MGIYLLITHRKQKLSMIQPNELRLNSLIQTCVDKEWIAANDMIVKSKIEFYNSYNQQTCEGIPVTKELLVENCGFRTTSLGELFVINDDIDLWFIDGIISLSFSKSDVTSFRSIRKDLQHIRYLHQVQNLIYSMSGNEMHIKM